ncbi:uncharacterized protein LOC110720226 [Chenopodium quinoa]|uniref:uncharacterized protein LOC110720226 n=1 Tax=Chenopodium quinoa TaxID=63459 RepID=UPI000B78D91D|nr:uncharacterized protein LOC110720226 [Chenopodium quinoa]
MNVDASFKDRISPAGIAMVVRNSRGEWIMGGQCKRWANSAMSAELWALWEGLSLIMDNNCSNVTISSDCKVAIHLITYDVHYDSELSGLIRTCRELLRRNMRLKNEYGSRNTNVVADAMAKSCRNNSTINVNEPTSCIVTPSGLIEELYLKELANTN